ncbi:hypothetical protein [Actinomadura sp. 3N508]|uniref:hypothetical protein n=1 Tax=Actinomadura sp. 3N508 TaxID=3375153 RepID=UPI0037A5C287
MTAIDARWFADKATAASWSHALLVQPGLEDAEAAADAEDWATCLLACLLTAERLAFCELVLDGRAASPREAELLLALGTAPTPVTDGLRELQRLRAEAAADIDRATAEAALACLATADEHVRDRIPIDVLPMRTPEGFYPSLRVAATLEQLRKSVGLGPFQWDWWTNLS